MKSKKKIIQNRSDETDSLIRELNSTTYTLGYVWLVRKCQRKHKIMKKQNYNKQTLRLIFSQFNLCYIRKEKNTYLFLSLIFSFLSNQTESQLDRRNNKIKTRDLTDLVGLKRNESS